MSSSSYRSFCSAEYDQPLGSGAATGSSEGGAFKPRAPRESRTAVVSAEAELIRKLVSLRTVGRRFGARIWTIARTSHPST
eukprot:5974986-Prymnesium_polylepis.1